MDSYCEKMLYLDVHVFGKAQSQCSESINNNYLIGFHCVSFPLSFAVANKIALHFHFDDV